MPDWLETFLRHSQARNIRDLADELADKLNRQWTPPKSNDGTGFHLAGYEMLGGVSVPSFYHVYNHTGVDAGYKVTGAGFRTTPDFFEEAKDYFPSKLDDFFSGHWSNVYRNGALSHYVALAKSLYEFTEALWQTGLLKQPTKVEEWAWYYKFHLETVKLMYRYLVKKKFPPIGRGIDVYIIDTTGKISKLPNRRSVY
jgi:hypothetical protein